MQIGKWQFDLERHTYVCGILNVTPDSFSDGGKWNQRDSALFQVEQMIKDGMDLLDVGGESTHPGYEAISVEEEIQRVVPILQEIRTRFDIPISIDTYKAEVARAALEVGADMVNDIWGLQWDAGMAEVIAKSGACCCLMHNRRSPIYEDFLADVISDLKQSLLMAKRAGIANDKIILDPGIGFAKTTEQNLYLLRHLETITSLGYPVLLGASRKSVIGNVLDLPVLEREEGTLVTTVLGAQKGCAFVRVHNVRASVRALRMWEAIRDAKG